jgi:FixJ family two-component response regulator
MPEMGGTKLAEVLLRLNPAVALLFISGAGADGPVEPPPPGRPTLQKPFTREELLAAVQRAMGRPAT